MRIFLSITFFCCVFVGVNAQKTKQEVAEAINSKYSTYSTIAKKIWEYAEVGYKEAKSSALLQERFLCIRNHVTISVANAGDGDNI